MTNIAKVGDLGHGYCKAGHPDVEVGQPKEFVTTFVNGATSVFLNGVPVAVVTTIGDSDCGHTTTAISGSGSVFAENLAVHRLNDIGVINEGEGEYVVITSSNDTEAGD